MDKWQPLVPGSLGEPPSKEKVIEMHKAQGLPLDDESVASSMEVMKDICENDEIWVNDIYQVNVLRRKDITHLSIKRRDKSVCKDWRHFQLIKNQLVGEENEAVELYPAESRLVDTANQYHLWVINDPGYRFPFGFNDGRRIAKESAGGAVQRPRNQ